MKRAFLAVVGAIVIAQLGQSHEPFYFGNDLSYVNQMEDCGAVYRENGEVKDPFVLMAEHGGNLVRVRLWNDPWWQRLIPQPVEGVKEQYNDIEDVTRTIRRAKETGAEVMLGIHLSDIWADPGRQIVPREWLEIAGDTAALEDAVYRYVFDTLRELDREGLMPDIVKLGNETNPGIMVEERLEVHWNAAKKQLEIESPGKRFQDEYRLAAIWNAGIRAVRDAGERSRTEPKIALHVSGLENLVGYYDWMIRIGVTDFDIMGCSYYYAWHEGSIEELGATMKELKAKYPDYEVMLAETGYLWDEENIDGLGNIITTPDPRYLPVSKENQLQYMKDLTQEVIDAGGIGVIFWEPAWVSTPCLTPWGQGSSHEHVAYFDHRNGNEFHVGGTWMEAAYANLPEKEATPIAISVAPGAEGATVSFETIADSAYTLEESSDLICWTRTMNILARTQNPTAMTLLSRGSPAVFARVWRIENR